MPDQTPPAVTAVADQIEATAKDLHDFIQALSPEDLLAELRCTIGRLTQYAARETGSPLHPLSLNLSVLSEGLSRFDLGGALCEDGHLDEGHRPVPGAARASRNCLCHTPGKGVRGFVNRLHDLAHSFD